MGDQTQMLLHRERVFRSKSDHAVLSGWLPRHELIHLARRLNPSQNLEHLDQLTYDEAELLQRQQGLLAQRFLL